jgi:predicted ABC-type transport system involved in lysophospholipase L1 biosynthesis ATPase subunit
MTHVVELDHVFRVYPTEEGGSAALQGLTFTVREGEIVVVFGPSGSGKTTMLRILAGFDRPSSGRVDVLGVDLRRLGTRKLDDFRGRFVSQLASWSRSHSASPAWLATDNSSAPTLCSTSLASLTAARHTRSSSPAASSSGSRLPPP